MESHTKENWKFNSRQEVQEEFNQIPVRRVVQNDYTTMENQDQNPSFYNNPSYRMLEEESLMGRYNIQKGEEEEVQEGEIQSNEMSHYHVMHQSQQGPEAGYRYTPEDSLEMDRRLQIEEMDRNTSTMLIEIKEPKEEWNPANPHKFREVHRAEKGLMFDTVMNIQYIIVNQQQIDTERHLELKAQMERVLKEVENINRGTQYMIESRYQDQMRTIMEILEEKGKAQEKSEQTNQKIITMIEENRKIEREGEERKEAVEKLAEVQRREIFQEIKQVE
jgi:hypothetical protein